MRLKKLRREAEAVIERAADEQCHLFEWITPIECGGIGLCIRTYDVDTAGIDYRWYGKALQLKELA